MADGSLAGVLAWYSLIHTPPEVLGEIARCVRPGGGMALGFFAGTSIEPFDHAIVTAYRWPVEELAGLVEQAGFEVTGTRTRPDPSPRRRHHGMILARRTSDGTTQPG